jgi:hypothetical protein
MKDKKELMRIKIPYKTQAPPLRAVGPWWREDLHEVLRKLGYNKKKEECKWCG